MSRHPLELSDHAGRTTTFRKTVSESDVYLFAGITGDLAPYHVDEQYMSNSVYGGRIAHGVLVLGLVSTASTIYWTDFHEVGNTISAGYDHVRFLAGVRIGDTLAVTYEVDEVDASRGRVAACATVTNQHGETVLVARHLTKIVDLSTRGPNGALRETTKGHGA